MEYGSISQSFQSNPAETAAGKQLTTCKLCLVDDIYLHDMMRIKSCGCMFCYQCMQSYVESLITDRAVLSITCPDGGCAVSGTLSENEIAQLIPSGTFEKYLEVKFEQEVVADPNRTFCPKCSAVCHLGDGKEMKLAPVSVTCATCRLEFCFDCKSDWSSGHRCPIFSWLEESGSNGADAKIKRCPVCRTLIERNRGCATMTCSSCKHEFCWYCLTLLDNDVLMLHFARGPCKGKSDHNPYFLNYLRLLVILGPVGMIINGVVALVGVLVVALIFLALLFLTPLCFLVLWLFACLCPQTLPSWLFIDDEAWEVRALDSTDRAQRDIITAAQSSTILNLTDETNEKSSAVLALDETKALSSSVAVVDESTVMSLLPVVEDETTEMSLLPVVEDETTEMSLLPVVEDESTVMSLSPAAADETNKPSSLAVVVDETNDLLLLRVVNDGTNSTSSSPVAVDETKECR